MLFGLSGAVAQDTTQAYPWRMSYFPYVTASPNDGLMAMARVVWFQASRWSAKTSVDRQVAIEGGYSTRDAWLARVRGDFPRLAPGWRLQAIAEFARLANFVPDQPYRVRADRRLLAAEITRRVTGALHLALRGETMHLAATARYPDGTGLPDIPFPAETDHRARAALVFDLRDREYDTRRGALLQTGVFAGSGGGGYHGWYGLAAGWVPLSERTRVTARVGARALSRPDSLLFDAPRVMPAWEDEFVVLGGPESNRELAVGEQRGRGVLLSGIELRHDVFVFPGGSVALFAFADAGRVFNDITVAGPPPVSENGDLRITLHGWTTGGGAGIALRLLRNAVLTASVGHTSGSTRAYVGSGWAW